MWMKKMCEGDVEGEKRGRTKEERGLRREKERINESTVYCLNSQKSRNDFLNAAQIAMSDI